MSAFYSILIDLGILGFFGLLYYWFQRRRIIRASVLEVQDRIQEFLYDLHAFLDKNKNASFYTDLDAFALNLEKAANTHDLKEMRVALSNIPPGLPSEFQKELSSIEALF